MKNVYVSQKIEQLLPEWVPYQLWYTLNDCGCFRGCRQECHLYLRDGQQCLHILQTEPPAELIMSFSAEQTVSARIVIRRQSERVVMMLADEEAEFEVSVSL